MAGRSTFGSIRKLPSGRYQASYWHEGERYIGPETYASKGDADAWLGEVRTDIRKGAWIDPNAGKAHLRQYADKWLDDRHDLAERTKELYRYLLDRYVLSKFGDYELVAIKPSAVRSWHASIAKNHPTTAAKAYRLFATIMRTAVEDRQLSYNPVQIKGASKEEAPERPIATIAEVQALADAMPEHLRIAVLLAAWCQLRRAEILGLRRKDVDLVHRTIEVRRTRTRTMKGATVDKAPKTKAGRRMLAVPPNIIPDIENHLNAHVGADPDALILEAGHKPLRTAFENARAKIGRTDLTLHDLRHSGLTWASATGASVAELMVRAGHKSPIAALRYQHATEDRDRVLADAMAALAPQAGA